MNQNAQYWIEKLQLAKHPEGGYFKETYRCQEEIGADQLPARFEGDRSFSTAIYFLLESHQISRFHRIKSDELWHFYAGSSLTVYVLDRGKLTSIQLGPDVEQGDVFQAVVQAGCWFGAVVNQPSSYSGLQHQEGQ